MKKVVFTVFLCALSLLSCIVTVHAQDIAAHEAEKARLQEEIELINRRLAANKSKEKYNVFLIAVSVSDYCHSSLPDAGAAHEDGRHQQASFRMPKRTCLPTD